MKVAIAGTPKSEMNPRIAAIQMWIGKNGSSIANAYQVQASTLEELNAPRGVIEKVLWRIARQEPPMELTTQTLLEALEERNLLREVRKQLKLTDKEVKTSVQNFNKSRHAWIASRVLQDVRDRDALVRDVESWVKSELPEMTDREAIMEAVDIRLQAGQDFRPGFPPLGTQQRHLDELAEQSPGRVYHQKRTGRTFLIVKPGEKATLTDAGIEIKAPEAPRVEVPSIS